MKRRIIKKANNRIQRLFKKYPDLERILYLKEDKEVSFFFKGEYHWSGSIMPSTTYEFRGKTRRDLDRIQIMAFSHNREFNIKRGN